ncbi:hypothetical protein [Butyrivibrio sp. MC2013]|uniref:hypothetical protein n=1 Tax=Butyrivibrio sp. MC2013 TaxID=1280686 RepID=UPI0004110A08|nr:hypothetical protein [Butyrivibrio sp. MC2013]
MSKYDELISKVEVTAEMRARILQNIEKDLSGNAPGILTGDTTGQQSDKIVKRPGEDNGSKELEKDKKRKARIYSFSRIAAAAAAFMLLAGGSYLFFNVLSGGNHSSEPISDTSSYYEEAAEPYEEGGEGEAYESAAETAESEAVEESAEYEDAEAASEAETATEEAAAEFEPAESASDALAEAEGTGAKASDDDAEYAPIFEPPMSSEEDSGILHGPDNSGSHSLIRLIVEIIEAIMDLFSGI